MEPRNLLDDFEGPFSTELSNLMLGEIDESADSLVDARADHTFEKLWAHKCPTNLLNSIAMERAS